MRTTRKIVAFVLVVLSASPLWAQKMEVKKSGETTKVRNILIGVVAGVSLQYTGLHTTFSTELEVGYKGLFRGRFGFSASLSYTRPTMKGQLPYNAGYSIDGTQSWKFEKYKTTLDVLTLGIHVFYRFFDDSKFWTPWISVGPGFFFTRHKVNAFGSTNTETGIAYGFIGSFGFDFNLGIGAITIVCRFPWAPKNNKTLGDTHLGNAVIQAGYRFMF